MITNEGAAQARAVQVTVDGQPIVEHERMLVTPDEVERVLGPGGRVRYKTLITFGAPPVFDVLVSWEDDSGELGLWHSQLSWH